MNETRQKVAEEIRRMGYVFNEDVLKGTYALYVPLQERAPKEGVEMHMELAYGDDERHRLDVFTPKERPAKPAPVVVYFHGGGYVAGTRSPVPGQVYDNVPTFFARHGMIGVNATYRLAPQHQWPSGGADVGRVVEWLIENVARYGGDPKRIFLMGQSAGATHVATWTFMDKVHGPKGPRIAGAMLLSGVYGALHPDYDNSKPRENQLAYYGDDLAKWADMTPFGAVKAGHPPVFMVTSEYEPYPFVWPQAALLSALVKCDRKMPWFRMMPDNNHVSSALQINSEIDELGADLLEFVASVR
jgi:acetyl esterase/lipase